MNSSTWLNDLSRQVSVRHAAVILVILLTALTSEWFGGIFTERGHTGLMSWYAAGNIHRDSNIITHTALALAISFILLKAPASGIQHPRCLLLTGIGALTLYSLGLRVSLPALQWLGLLGGWLFTVTILLGDVAARRVRMLLFVLWLGAPSVLDPLTLPLQLTSARTAEVLLSWTGSPIQASGIHFLTTGPNGQPEPVAVVAEVCSGTVGFFVFLSYALLLVAWQGHRNPAWIRYLIYVSSVVIAWAANSIRIGVIILVMVLIGEDAGNWMHDHGSIIPIGLALMFEVGSIMFLLTRFSRRRAPDTAQATHRPDGHLLSTAGVFLLLLFISILAVPLLPAAVRTGPVLSRGLPPKYSSLGSIQSAWYCMNPACRYQTARIDTVASGKTCPACRNPVYSTVQRAEHLSFRQITERYAYGRPGQLPALACIVRPPAGASLLDVPHGWILSRGQQILRDGTAAPPEGFHTPSPDGTLRWFLTRPPRYRGDLRRLTAISHLSADRLHARPLMAFLHRHARALRSGVLPAPSYLMLTLEKADMGSYDLDALTAKWLALFRDLHATETNPFPSRSTEPRS